MTFEIFGLVIHGYSAVEAIERLRWMNAQGKQVMIVTANPEILLAAKRDARYWNVLRQADLRLVDSIGLQCAGRMRGVVPHRVPGVDFAEKLLEESIEHGWRVAFIGGQDEIVERAGWNMRKKFPEIILSTEQGGTVSMEGESDEKGNEALMRLTQFAPDVIFVAFGHPKQESWIVQHLAQLPSVKVAIGVGGALDYWSGSVKRAPHWMQACGLEWLYRLLREPKRIKRILQAVFVFPYYALKEKLAG